MSEYSSEFIYTPPKDAKPVVSEGEVEVRWYDWGMAPKDPEKDQTIKDCVNCQDETWPDRYMHHVYLDGNLPQWTCESHIDFSRKWIGFLCGRLRYNKVMDQK